MSVVQGPRDRRGRGRTSAAPTTRGNRGSSTVKPTGRAVATTVATLNSPPSRQYRPPPAPNGSHRGVPRSSPSLSRGAPDGCPPRSIRASTSTPPQQKARRNVENRNTGAAVQRRMDDLYQKLKNDREQERKDAIRDGVLADPDKPTALANAITPIGTCQDMCPRFERAERIMQLMVDGCEKKTSPSGIREPCEERMVKRFRRSAAGYDEQLPSDIRPPLVLQKTLDYLIDEVIGGSQPLAAVHKFVWDRTRGIRNDFSIQQVTRVEDLRIAIDCFERITRFHLLSLHQLSRPDQDSSEFDHHQEREQLNNTLLSLVYYYDDSRHKLKSPNEAEFRAYCIIFEIQDQRPDLEDRAQQWPRPLLHDQRVQTALKLYAAAGNTSDEQGPLRPRASFLTAQANTGRFWDLIHSNAVPYTMACIAEIYFNLIRRIALEAVWKAYKGKRAGPSKMEDWVLADLTMALGFDSEDQAQSFVEDHGFLVAENDDNLAYIDLGSVSSRNLIDNNPRRKQVFSKTLVEVKRLDRTLSAIINGLTTSQARDRGMIDNSLNPEDSTPSFQDSLFVSGESDDELAARRDLGTASEKRESKDFGTNPGLTNKTSLSQPMAAGVPHSTSASTSAARTSGKPNSTSAVKPPQSAFGSLDTSRTSQATSSRFGIRSVPNPFGTPLTTEENSSSTKASAGLSFLAEESGASSSNRRPTAFSSPFRHNELHESSSPIDRSQSIFQFQPNSNADDSGKQPAKAPASPFAAFSNTTTAQNSPLVSPFGKPTGSADSLSISNQDSANRATDENNTWSTIDPTVINPRAPAPALNATQPIPFSVTQAPSSLNPEPTSSKPTDDLYQFASLHSHTPPFIKDVQQQSAQANSTLKISSMSNDSARIANDDSAKFCFPAVSSRLKPLIEASSENTVDSNETQISTARIASTPVNQGLQVPAVKITSSATKKFRPSDTAGSETPPMHEDPPIAAPSLYRSGQLPKSDRHDAHIGALNALSEALMLSGEGLLKQFIEYTIGPTISASFRQIEEERSWQQAGKSRALLLSKKYLQLWKKNTWRLALLRKGKVRRKLFAESMRKLAHSRRGHSNTDSILDLSPSTLDAEAKAAMPPPAKLSNKRNSLQASIDHQPLSSITPSNKRKLDSPQSDRSPIDSKANHKRSRRVTSVIRNNLTEGPVYSAQGERVDNAARLSFANKADTTQTDYFRLKALGIDPNTPTVPATRKKRSIDDGTSLRKKRSRQWLSQEASDSESRIPLRTPASLVTDIQTASNNNVALQNGDNSDEALFTRLRKVREAMLDSILWFQSEREKSKRTSSGSNGEVRPNESPAQKTLRDFRMTPSRTEQRLRSTGASGLLPKAWASNPSWRDAEGTITTTVDPGLQSSSFSTSGRHGTTDATAAQGIQRSVVKVAFQNPRRANSVWPEGAGSSIDDAIEL